VVLHQSFPGIGSLAEVKKARKFVQRLHRGQGKWGGAAFDFFGVRYVEQPGGSDRIFGCVADDVMLGASLAELGEYARTALLSSTTDASAPMLPINPRTPVLLRSKLASLNAITSSSDVTTLLGPNALTVPVPSLITTVLAEVSQPFYVFQLLCCVLWTIDNYLAYGYGLMLFIFLGALQSSHIFVKSRREMRALAGQDFTIMCLRSDSGSASSSSSSSSSWTSVPQSFLVPGDVIKIASGSTIPADCIIVAGSVLVDESMLTGESLPLSKCAPEAFDARVYVPSVMKKCSLFSGAVCKSSKGVASDGDDGDACAVAVVVRTGMHSHKGVLLQALLLPVDFEPPYAREASFFLFLMFLYSLWNFAVTQRLVQLRDPDSTFNIYR